MTRLGLKGESGESGDPAKLASSLASSSHFVALLLSLCYPVGDSFDWRNQEARHSTLGISSNAVPVGSNLIACTAGALLLTDIKSFCLDAKSKYRISKVLAFLEGHHTRLGHDSHISLLPDLPLQIIARRFLSDSFTSEDSDLRNCVWSHLETNHAQFLGLASYPALA